MKLAVWIVLASLVQGLAHGQGTANAGLAERVDAVESFPKDRLTIAAMARSS